MIPDLLQDERVQAAIRELASVECEPSHNAWVSQDLHIYLLVVYVPAVGTCKPHAKQPLLYTCTTRVCKNESQYGLVHTAMLQLCSCGCDRRSVLFHFFPNYARNQSKCTFTLVDNRWIVEPSRQAVCLPGCHHLEGYNRKYDR